LQSNQQQAHSNNWKGKVCRGVVTDIGYAPILLFIMILSMILFINSVIAGTQNLYINLQYRTATHMHSIIVTCAFCDDSTSMNLFH